MAKTHHLPATIFMLRKVGEYPNGFVRTLTTDGKRCSSLYVSLTRQDSAGIDWSVAHFQLDRRLARLLAHRILECLEASK